MNDLVAIIILNWNSASDTIECIESCKKLNYKNYRIIVVDNNSNDKSEKDIRAKHPDIEIIQTGENLGYSGGNNVGIKYAKTFGADYVWLLNSDAVVFESTLDTLVSTFNSSSIGMVSPIVLQYHNPELIDFSGGVVDKSAGVIKHIGRGDTISILNENLEQNSDFLTGCAVIMRMEVINQVGLLNEDYFLYCEDVDYSIRVKMHGFKVFVSPASFVLHKISTSTRKEKGLITFYKTRNTLILLSRFFIDFADWKKRFALDLKKFFCYLKVLNLRGAFNVFIAYLYWIFLLVGPKNKPKRIKKYRYHQ